MADKQRLSVDNTVFFSTANAGYATFAAVSLLGIRKYIPDAQLYILSSGLSDNDRRLLDKNSIKYHELDLSDIFTRTWDYPVDCYYLFYGPEFFIKQGFEYSVYIDGDVLCRDNPLAGISNVSCVAGVESASVDGKYISVFGKDWEGIKNTWGLADENERRKRINAGVVYFNNKKMLDVGLLSKAGQLFKESLKNNIPRKGDDSLFSLFQYVHLEEEDVKILPPKYNYVLQFHKEWNYPVNDLTFFHFSLDKPWKKKPYQHKDLRLNVFNPYIKEWRAGYRKIAPAMWVSDLVRSVELLNKSIDLTNRASVKTKQVLKDALLWRAGLKKSLLVRRANYRKKPLNVYWWRSEKIDIKNFGDEITADILDKVFGYRCELATVDSCAMISTGSILEIAMKRKDKRPIDVWGSGFIKDGVGDDLEGLNFYAVRGKVTSDRVNRQDIALGDPGLLANITYDASKYKSSKIGVVFHYADEDLPIIKKIRDDPRFVLISPIDKPSEVARRITGCRLVLSSSLHGLIFSDSFAVPNMHIKLSDRLSGGTYKFVDYYSALGRHYEGADVDKMFNDEYLGRLIDGYEPISDLKSIQKKLIEAFPY